MSIKTHHLHLGETMLTSLKVKDIAVFKHGNIGIIFKRVNENLVEIEVLRQGHSEFVGMAGILEDDEITIIPYPLGRGSSNKCMLFKFKRPIMLLPNSTISIDTYLPFSIAIYSKNALINIINTFKIKLALYGSPTMGDLCIYIKEGDMSLSAESLANLRITISNNTHEPSLVEKIIIPVDGLGVFISEYGDIAYNVIKASLVSTPRGIALEVSTTLEPSGRDNFKEIIKPETITYIMRHGY